MQPTDYPTVINARRAMTAMRFAMTTMRFIGDNLTREYLRFVRVEPIDGGGAWIVATDGKAMLIQRDNTAIVQQPVALTFHMIGVPDDGFFDSDYPAREFIGSDTTIKVPQIAAGEAAAAPICWFGGQENGEFCLVRAGDATTFPAWRDAVGRDVTDRAEILQRSLSLTDTTIGVEEIARFGAVDTSIKVAALNPKTMQFLITFPRDFDAFGILTATAAKPTAAARNDLLRAIGRGDLAAPPKPNK